MNLQKIFPKKKKAQFGFALIDFWAYVVFVVIILFFFILFSIKGCNVEKENNQFIKSEFSDLDADLILQNYLRTTVEVNNKNMTIADLIVLSRSNPSFQAILRSKGNKISRFQSKCTILYVDQKMYPFNDCTSYHLAKVRSDTRQTLPFPNDPIDVLLDLNPPAKRQNP